MVAQIMRKSAFACVTTDNGKHWQLYVDENGAIQIEEFTLDGEE